MRLTNNKVYEYTQEPGIDGIYKAISDTARICYQTDASKSKLTPKEFVENTLLKLGHGRALEFGTVYLKIPTSEKSLGKYQENPYTKINYEKLSGILPSYKSNRVHSIGYVTTNMRVIMQGDYENDEEAWKNNYDKNWLDDLKYLCEPTEHHYKRRTFDLILSRGASDDLRTHITLSSMCESTRFCNYSKGKYGNQLTGIKPYWIDFKTEGDVEVKTYHDGSIDNEQIRALDENDYQFVTSMALEEMEYMRHAETGLQPQQLKRLFPLWGKCELRLCGYEDAWDNFMWRRLDGHADPECTKIAELIQNIRNAHS
ncbi:MAG: FAD-dependent thymidylate synthase [Bacteroidales bacterium]|nr:FAD-dependent thymidylate synthase [Bacteroidales bacterium]